MPHRSALEIFDLGASEAMANTEFSSGIYEAPELSPESSPSTGSTRGISPIDRLANERRVTVDGTLSKGSDQSKETTRSGGNKGR